MVVLDACAAMDISVMNVRGKYLRSELENSDEVIVPVSFYTEFMNTLYKHIRGGNISYDEAVNYFWEISHFVTASVDMKDAYEEVLREAAILQHPAYDICYFVLARRHNAILLTSDKRLANLCADNRVSCVHFFNKEEMLYD